MIDLAPKDCKIYTDNIEEEALSQIKDLTQHPAFKSAKIRIMPDVHAGKGCVIGFTADLGGKVVPNLVGVDICCGMLTVPINENELNSDDFKKLDRVIRKKVPSGMNVNEQESEYVNMLLNELRCKKELKNISHLAKSLGTLGGGNHFIEVDKSCTGQQYLVIHTGSRNLGKQICELYQQKAIKSLSPAVTHKGEKDQIIKELKDAGKQSEIQNAIKEFNENIKAEAMPDDLCYLIGDDKNDYIHDCDIAKAFARENRMSIAEKIFNGMDWEFNRANTFETLHNYIDSKTGMIRKGAVSAREGERLLIPLNMAEGSLICTGKGNEEWNQSAPHGAGRVLSRGQAKKTLDITEYKGKMDGVYTSCICEGTLDESPMAYKPMRDIVSNIMDTVNVEDWIQPTYNYKAIDEPVQQYKKEPEVEDQCL